MSEWWQHSPYAVIPGATQAALLAGALLPLLGMWIVLQRVVFLGVALAQVAAAGVALGLMLHVPALPLGLALCALAVTAFTGRLGGRVGSGGDSALGAVFCIASALAVLFISRSPADLDQVSHVLHGNLIFATGADVRLMAAALLGGTLVIGLVFPRILFCAFDGETAAALGLAVRGWLLLLFGVLAVVLTLSMRTTGALLTFALLVLPALAALQLRRGLRASFALASVLGLLGALAGLLLAVNSDLHLESAIVLTSFLLVPLAWVWMRSPPLALLAAAGLALAAPLLAPERLEAPGASHRHPPDGSLAHAPAAPYHFDLHLDARRLEGGAELEVRWSLDAHRDDLSVPLPPALWLVLVGDGLRDERPLVADTGAIGAGLTLIEDSFRLPADARVTRLEGQIWSAPTAHDEALPVDHCSVIGCDVR
ncbi:MAG TPA: metal ABC transporter permease [Planctomycetota bacterium]|nr:metal ABC transporter permease [Planctomycetota bacterium]